MKKLLAIILLIALALTTVGTPAMALNQVAQARLFRKSMGSINEQQIMKMTGLNPIEFQQMKLYWEQGVRSSKAQCVVGLSVKSIVQLVLRFYRIYCTESISSVLA